MDDKSPHFLADQLLLIMTESDEDFKYQEFNILNRNQFNTWRDFAYILYLQVYR